jgi:hypothetical protein
MSTTAITPQEQRLARPSAAFGTRGIIISQYDELVRFAETVASSGLAPKGMENPKAVFVAVQMGLEVGLTPMAALQNVAVVNGRPTLWGDAQLAVCRGTGELELFEEWFEVGGQKTTRNPSKYEDDTAAICKVKRANGQAVESAFSVADAKRANLWGKAGPWTQYPFRMLRNRARSFALRDTFGDALKGFRSAEEVQDEAPVRDVTPPSAATSALFQQPAPLPEAKPSRRKAAPPPDPQPDGELIDVPAASLAEQINARCEADGVTWQEVAESLHANGLAAFLLDSPFDASEEVLRETLAMWTQVVAAVKAAREGGAA